MNRLKLLSSFIGLSLAVVACASETQPSEDVESASDDLSSLGCYWSRHVRAEPWDTTVEVGGSFSSYDHAIPKDGETWVCDCKMYRKFCDKTSATSEADFQACKAALDPECKSWRKQHPPISGSSGGSSGSSGSPGGSPSGGGHFRCTPDNIGGEYCYCDDRYVGAAYWSWDRKQSAVKDCEGRGF